MLAIVEKEGISIVADDFTTDEAASSGSSGVRFLALAEEGVNGYVLRHVSDLQW